MRMRWITLSVAAVVALSYSVAMAQQGGGPIRQSNRGGRRQHRRECFDSTGRTTDCVKCRHARQRRRKYSNSTG